MGLALDLSLHLTFVSATGLSVDLITSPALLGYCGTVIVAVTTHGAALLLLLPAIAEELWHLAAGLLGQRLTLKR